MAYSAKMVIQQTFIACMLGVLERLFTSRHSVNVFKLDTFLQLINYSQFWYHVEVDVVCLPSLLKRLEVQSIQEIM